MIIWHGPLPDYDASRTGKDTSKNISMYMSERDQASGVRMMGRRHVAVPPHAHHALRGHEARLPISSHNGGRKGTKPKQASTERGPGH